MSQAHPPEPPDNFDARLRQARAEADPGARRGPGDAGIPAAGVAMALRIGTELVAALIVGVGIGWVLDRWLETTPWLMVVFFFLGSAAGILNVYRTASGIGYAAGYAPPAAGSTDGPAVTEQNDEGRTPD
mgnify:CR=1 FL=1|jgi:ATP synthase protein I